MRQSTCAKEVESRWEEFKISPCQEESVWHQWQREKGREGCFFSLHLSTPSLCSTAFLISQKLIGSEKAKSTRVKEWIHYTRKPFVCSESRFFTNERLDTLNISLILHSVYFTGHTLIKYVNTKATFWSPLSLRSLHTLVHVLAPCGIYIRLQLAIAIWTTCHLTIQKVRWLWIFLNSNCTWKTKSHSWKSLSLSFCLPFVLNYLKLSFKMHFGTSECQKVLSLYSPSLLLRLFKWLLL